MADFQRDFDELFDDLLIGRWRTPAADSDPAMVLEHENDYEVRLCTGAFKPSELEVVVNEKNLTVRATQAANPWKRQLSFTDPVQTENVTAKWANRILTIVLPKKNQRPRT
ncbi:MAG TPA: Hsp20/alpha crystallin family protein [Candidatus Binataceae bacterium]